MSSKMPARTVLSWCGRDASGSLTDRLLAAYFYRAGFEAAASRVAAPFLFSLKFIVCRFFVAVTVHVKYDPHLVGSLI